MAVGDGRPCKTMITFENRRRIWNCERGASLRRRTAAECGWLS